MAQRRRMRAPKQVSPPRTAAEIRELADRLRDLADQIDQCADVMQRQGIRQIRPLTGNFLNSLQTIRRFVHRQLLPRVADAAHEQFRPLDEAMLDAAAEGKRRGKRRREAARPR